MDEIEKKQIENLEKDIFRMKCIIWTLFISNIFYLIRVIYE